MMKRHQVLLVASCLYLFAVPTVKASVPVFPKVWNSDYSTKVAIFQGGTYDPKTGVACCQNNSPGCKVQTEGEAGTQYTDGEHNQTALNAGGEAIITKYGRSDNGKEMLVVPSKSGKGWTCKEYCPTDEEWFDPLAFNASAVNLGKVKINSKTYEHWRWVDTILKVIPMETEDWYVAEGDVPYKSTMGLTPFGGPEIGSSEQEFDNFKTGLNGFDFTVDGVDQCETGNCGDDSRAYLRKQLRKYQAAKRKVGRRSLYDLAKEKAGATFEQKRNAAAVNGGQWASDWSSETTSSMLINQGGQPNADKTAICCSSSYSGQCAVQSQYASGMQYTDYTNQRARSEDPVNGIVVALYSKDGKTPGKNMLVEQNGTHEVCVKYCPLDPGETLGRGKSAWMDPNATDMGKVKFEGHDAIKYQWNDTIFGKITMQINDFYATPDDVPIAEISELTPFGGPAIGNFHNTWSKFKAGPQPKDKFDIHGVDTCPQDPQCEQPGKQLQRLRMRQFLTFARYHYGVGK
jgi:hypothetical protein